jgi:hypothetical protein|tara:strand:- start:443 stop:874 length:432 start_codon:yes stop_codon:yes gene_type:complete
MSTAILDIQKAKLAGIQDIVSAMSRIKPDQPSPYINTHHFAPGIYMRAYYGVKGSVVVSQVHLHEHMTILAAGHCRVISTMQDEERIDVYKDFAIMNTPPHTKRALYFLENTTIFGVFPNPDNIRDIPTLEAMFVVDSFEDIK